MYLMLMSAFLPIMMGFLLQTYTNENICHELFKLDEKNVTNLARSAKIIMSHFKQEFYLQDWLQEKYEKHELAD